MKELTKRDVEIIRTEAAKHGYRTDRKIAEAIGISYQTFSRKLNGHADFTLKELIAMRDVLGLSKNQISAIFLTETK